MDRNNRQKGLAIGLILLAIVLIGAIVAAVAIGMDSSAQRGDKEEARVRASGYIVRTTSLVNATKRYFATGGISNSDYVTLDLITEAGFLSGSSYNDNHWAIIKLDFTDSGGNTVERILFFSIEPGLDLETCLQLNILQNGSTEIPDVEISTPNGPADYNNIPRVKLAASLGESFTGGGCGVFVGDNRYFYFQGHTVESFAPGFTS